MSVTGSFRLTYRLLQRGLLTAGQTQHEFVKNLRADASALGLSKAYSDELTLGASASLDVDLNGGSASDAFGIALSFTKVHLLYLRCDDGNAGDIRVQPAASSGWADWIGGTSAYRDLAPSETHCQYDPAGITVTPGSDQLNFTNQEASTQKIIVVILGT